MTTDKHRGDQTQNVDRYQTDHPFVVTRLGYFFDGLARLIVSVKPSYVLNLGCGEGFDMRSILGRSDADFAYSCGLDLRFEALTMAKSILPPFQFDAVQGDLRHLPFNLDGFDMIVCLEVLEHLKHPQQVLRELSQRFRGHCLFSVPNEPYYRLTRLLLFRRNIKQLGNHPEHLNHWSTAGFVRFTGEYLVIDQVMAPFPWTVVLCHGKKL